MKKRGVGRDGETIIVCGPARVVRSNEDDELQLWGYESVSTVRLSGDYCFA